ncbi:MAG: hypothetical protein ACF8OB_20160 [Phycisphaeraceae bacterium JB051]
MPVYTPPANNALDAELVIYTPTANNALDADFTGSLSITPVDIVIDVPDASWSGLAKIITPEPIEVTVEVPDATFTTLVDLVIEPDPIEISVEVPDATLTIQPVVVLGITPVETTVEVPDASLSIQPVVTLGTTPIEVTVEVPDALFLKDLLIIPDPIEVTIEVPDATFNRLANLANCFLVYENGYVHRVIAAPAAQLNLEGLFPKGLWTLGLSYVDQYGNESSQAMIEVEFDSDGHVISQLREIDTIEAAPVAGGYIALIITLEDKQAWHRDPTGFEVFDTASQSVIGTITAPGNGAYITEATAGPFTHGQTKRLKVRPYDVSGYGVWSDAPSVVVFALGPVAPVVVC